MEAEVVSDLVFKPDDPLYLLWCSAVDAVNSKDFRSEDGEINEEAYLRYQTSAIATARAATSGVAAKAGKGWWAEEDCEEDQGWRPVLQLDGYVATFDIWFRTEQDCEDWIRTSVIGAGMLGAT